MARLAGKTGSVFTGSQTIFDCESAFDEQVIANVTATTDATSGNYQVGALSAKCTVAAAVTTGLIASKVVASMDLTSYSEVLCWIKSSINLSAGDYQLLLDDSALCGTPVRTIDFPAMTASTWAFVKLLDTMSGASAIVSVGLKQAVDVAALNFWIDNIQAAKTVAGIKSWTLDVKTDAVDSTGFDSSGHRSYLPNLDQWTGSFEGYKDGAPLTIGSIVGLELQETTATTTKQYRGNAIITDLKPTATVEGLVTYSYNFTGTDSLVTASA